MSRLGAPYDNAVMESFYKTLKTELLTGKRFESRHEAEKAIFEYIEMFYNTKRMHSARKYLCPREYEMKYTGLKGLISVSRKPWEVQHIRLPSIK
ncbi:IS3 family transposase [Alicyclobacillus contaminans]|uniref:IS3 family transposase n=1 Tax=Alicyclobacillus contaminans TaxID=392016 RepID=UPI000429A7E1|nr:IS3 family transposase [Alicyclobacillus contaminans]